MPAPPAIHRQERLLGPVDVALILCVLGLVYLTLRPWSGWRVPTHSLLRFLSGSPWDRYWTWDDVIVNLFAYLPLGMLIAARLRSALRGIAILALALLAGAALSFGLETLQNFLPTRVPSRLDLALNTAGTAVGAAAALLFLQRPNGGRELKWHRPAFATREALPVLLLVALWIVAQFAPQRTLFETGSLLSPALQTLNSLTGPAAAAASPTLQMAGSLAATLGSLQVGGSYSMLMESLSVAVSVCVIGLLLLEVVTTQRWRMLGVALVIVAGMLAHALSQSGTTGLAEPGLWLTAGAQAGLLIGLVLLSLLSSGTRRARLGWLLALIVAALLLTNLMPDNIYRSAAPVAQLPEFFRSILFGLQVLAVAWPLLTLGVVARLFYLHRQRWDGVPFMGSDVSMHLRPMPPSIRHAQ